MSELKLTPNAQTVLEKRCLQKDETGKVIETPEEMFRRVAKAVAKPESETSWEDKFYDMMTSLKFLPASPVLMNTGTKMRNSNACFVLPIEDSITDIFKTVGNIATIFQSGGGCLSKGSKVLTSTGIKFIEKVKVGDYVYSLNEKNNMCEWASVLQTHQYSPENKKIGTLLLEGRSSVTTTDWHPFMVLTDKGIIEKRLDELCINDLVINSDYKDENTICDNWFWLLGLIVSDGSFDITKQGVRLRIAKSNETIITRAAKILSCSYRKMRDKRYKVPMWEVGIRSKKVASLFNSYFIKNNRWKKAQTAFIPKQVWTATYTQQLSFLAGLMDGDTYFEKPNTCFSYSTVSKTLKEELLFLCGVLGFNTREREYKPKNLNWNINYEVTIKLYPGLGEKLISFTSRHKNIPLAKSFGNVKFPKQFKSLFPFKFKTKHYKRGVDIGGENIFFSRWLGTQGIIPKHSALHLLNYYNFENPVWQTWKKFLGGTKKVKSITWEQNCDLYDLTVKNNATYLASTKGAPVMVHNTGTNYSTLRPKGSLVKSSGGKSSGVVSFIKVVNETTEALRQGGKRKGASLAVLDVTHPDIEEFITCKKIDGNIKNINISVAITNKFMKAVKSNSMYNLEFNGKIYKEESAKRIWNLLIENSHQMAEPSIIFMDTINKVHPFDGSAFKIISCNPCAEMPLLNFESCTLGSINLANFVTKANKLAWGNLASITSLGVRFLDNTITVNGFPIPETEVASKKTRKIGLGIMGWGDLLFKLNIRYGSPESLILAEDVMEFINTTAQKASEDLAKEKGNFPAWEDSWWGKEGRPMRNATCTCIAPTGSLSIIANCSSGLEPNFALAYTKNVLDGEKLQVVNPIFKEKFEQECKKIGEDSQSWLESIVKRGTFQNTFSNYNLPSLKTLEEVFVTAQDIPWEEHVRMQAAFQKFVGSSISKTIALPATATKQDVEAAYMLAWELGCKGLTVYRDGSRKGQVLEVKKVNKSNFSNSVDSATTRLLTSCGKLYVTVNKDSDGNVIKVLCNMGKANSCQTAQNESIARLVTTCLKHEIPIDTVIRELLGVTCGFPCGLGSKKILSCGDAIAKSLKSIAQSTVVEDSKPLICKDCGMEMVLEEGCVKCYHCGYSKCG